MSGKLLVSGASGPLGGAVLEALLDRHPLDPDSLIAATRDPQRLGTLRRRGVRVRHADFDDPASLPAAFAGAKRMLLVSTDAPSGRRARQHVQALRAAREAGIEHVVYTSMLGVDGESAMPFAVDHRLTEVELARSGMTWTVLRINWMMETLHRFVAPSAASGIWATVAGSGSVSYVARQDCARAAAAALARSCESCGVFELSGPEPLSVQQIASCFSQFWRRSLLVQPLSATELRERAQTAGEAPAWIDLMEAFNEDLRVGRAARVGSGVLALTGVPPMSLQEYLRAQRSPTTGGDT